MKGYDRESPKLDILVSIETLLARSRITPPLNLDGAWVQSSRSDPGGSSYWYCSCKFGAQQEHHGRNKNIHCDLIESVLDVLSGNVKVLVLKFWKLWVVGESSRG